MSGGGGSARLESDADRGQIGERGVGDAISKCFGLRQQQYRRRREQHRARQRGDGADGAVFARVPVGIVMGRRQRGRRIDGAGRGEGGGNVGLRRDRLNGQRRRLRGASVEMPERQPKLQRQCQQRQPCPMFDVRAKPLHADRRPTSNGRDIPGRPML